MDGGKAGVGLVVEWAGARRQAEDAREISAPEGLGERLAVQRAQALDVVLRIRVRGTDRVAFLQQPRLATPRAEIPNPLTDAPRADAGRKQDFVRLLVRSTAAVLR